MKDKACVLCRAPITDSLTDRFCESCWYPGINEDYQAYKSLIKDGHRRVDALVISGLKGIEEV